MFFAVGAALLGAACCATAAALQQREAVAVRAVDAAGWRLLVSLARRPRWLAGLTALVMGAVLHVLALLNGPLSLVQPLGVTAVVFAVPVAAALYRYRVRIREMAAAATVAAGLCGLLFVIPKQANATENATGTMLPTLRLVIAALLAMGLLVVFAARRRPLTRALLLATGAGIALGVTAILLQMVLIDTERGGISGVLSLTGGAVVLLTVIGVLLTQQAYRVGSAAVVLATVTVVDPAASVFAVVALLGENFPTDALSLVLAGVSTAVITAGIAWLARSPVHRARSVHSEVIRT
jgi:drug/metabolite transporter (DMT)-like permease